LENYTNIADLQREIKEGKVQITEILDHFLGKIASSDHNAFLEVFTESSKEKARQVQEKINNNSAGKLAGMIIGIKDNLAYKGHKVSASSKILAGFESIYNATAIQRLLDEDAIIIGRLNCDEFAMGSSNENSAYGSVSHPERKDYVPGGSSGGSATAVGAGLCHASLGSDTGGSIRQPASFCDVIGLKPSYGRISRYGLLAYASSFDQIGSFTTSIEDASLLLEVMAGNDENDSTVSSKKVDDYLPVKPGQKYKISYIKEAIEHEGNDPEIVKAITDRLDAIKKMGHEVKPVSFPYLDYMVPAYYVLTTAEASSNLARYDGIRYGYRSGEAVDIESTYVKSRSEGFGKEVKRRIMLGSFVLSSGYYDAYYSKAQKVRNKIRQETNKILEESDFILLPTTPTTAFQQGAIKDQIKMYLQDIFTVHANLCGLPAISLPLDKHSNGLGFGTQLIGSAFNEKDLLQFSSELLNH